MHRKKQALLKRQSRQTNNKTTQTKLNRQRNENKLIKKMTKLAGEVLKNQFHIHFPHSPKTCHTALKCGREPI